MEMLGSRLLKPHLDRSLAFWEADSRIVVARSCCRLLVHAWQFHNNTCCCQSRGHYVDLTSLSRTCNHTKLPNSNQNKASLSLTVKVDSSVLYPIVFSAFMPCRSFVAFVSLLVHIFSINV